MGTTVNQGQPIQQARWTAAQWTAWGGVLLSGEEALESDTGQRKTGDGVTAWAALPYFTAAAGTADGVAAHGKILLGTGAFGSSIGLWTDTTEVYPRVVLGGALGGALGLSFGLPTGGFDWSLIRTAAATATITGQVRYANAQKTGWTAATGTATRTTFATSSVTTAQLAEHVKALIDDLISIGILGA